jgi:hypothetical protein
MRKPNSRERSWSAVGFWAVITLIAAILALGGPAPSAYAETPLVVGGKAIVTNTDGDPIRIRLGAGTEFGQIATAYEGQSVSILAGPLTDKTGIRWFMIQAPGGTGWMMAQFLRGTGTTTGAPAAPKLTGFALVANTDGDPLRMRSAPATSGKVLVLLDPGARVAVQEGPVLDSAGTSWYKITAKGITGWAMTMYLVQAPPAAAAVTEPAPKSQTPPQAAPVVARPAATATPVVAPTAKPAEAPKATSTMSQYRQWVEEARVMFPYKQTADKMWSVMMCESGGNARASGGGGRWLGLFQYAPATWGGRWNPYRAESIWDAKSQIFATAKAWSIGMQSHWSCYYITPGR